jgi:hypothetical protein
LYLIPGVKKIYLVGSVAQEIATQKSDVDLIFECFRGWVLPARMWLKLMLKLTSTDVHSIRLELLIFLCKNLGYRKLELHFKDKIKTYKNRSGLKIDAGIFCENRNQVYDYFAHDARNLSVLDLRYIPFLTTEVTMEEMQEQDNFCFYYRQSIFPGWLFKFLKSIFFVLSLPFYPLSFLQLIWFRLKYTEDIDALVKANFCCFYPRQPLAKYTTKLGDLANPKT